MSQGLPGLIAGLAAEGETPPAMSLAVDGTYMDAEFILEDPEYLARPMLHYRLLIPAPHLEMTYRECDEVNAGRWLRE